MTDSKAPLVSSNEEAPRPWRLWKAGERSELPHIADSQGRVVARAEGNVWYWQDFIAPMIVESVNHTSPVETEAPQTGVCIWTAESDSDRRWLGPSCDSLVDREDPRIVRGWRHCPYCGGEIVSSPKKASGSLLRDPSTHAPPGCHCQERCMAPVVMGRQTSCRDPEKAARFAQNGTRDSGKP